MVTESRPLLETTERDLLRHGDFFVDPWQPVDRAVITHAHADHACAGCGRYLTTRAGEGVMRVRLGPEVVVDAVGYGEAIVHNGVRVSLHPAGQFSARPRCGSSMRERSGWSPAITRSSPTPPVRRSSSVRCHVFVSESTFGLPIYRWPAQVEVFAVDQSLVAGQSRGAQGERPLRLRARQGPAASRGGRPDHRADRLPRRGGKDEPGLSRRWYRLAGDHACRGSRQGDRLESLPDRGSALGRRDRLAPPFRGGLAGFCVGLDADPRHAAAAGVDRGFVLSDHADWPGLLGVIDATGAERVLLTHGYTAVVARWLREQGADADTLETHYQGERDDAVPGEVAAEGTDEVA